VTSCSILIQRYLGFWWIAPTRSCYTPNTDRFLYKRSKCSWVNLYVHILRDQQSFLPNRNKFIVDRHKPLLLNCGDTTRRCHDTSVWGWWRWRWRWGGVGEETDILNFTFYLMETYFECKQNYIFNYKILPCEGIKVNPHAFLTVRLFGSTVIMMVILKSTITRLLKKLTAFYVFQGFITMCTTANPLLSLRTAWIQSITQTWPFVKYRYLRRKAVNLRTTSELESKPISAVWEFLFNILVLLYQV